MLGNPEKNEYICTEKMIGPLRKGDWKLNRAPFPDRMVLFSFLPDTYLSYPGRLSFICWGMYLF